MKNFHNSLYIFIFLLASLFFTPRLPALIFGESWNNLAAGEISMDRAVESFWARILGSLFIEDKTEEERNSAVTDILTELLVVIAFNVDRNNQREGKEVEQLLRSEVEILGGMQAITITSEKAAVFFLALSKKLQWQREQLALRNQQKSVAPNECGKNVMISNTLKDILCSLLYFQYLLFGIDFQKDWPLDIDDAGTIKLDFDFLQRANFVLSTNLDYTDGALATIGNSLKETLEGCIPWLKPKLVSTPAPAAKKQTWEEVQKFAGNNSGAIKGLVLPVLFGVGFDVGVTLGSKRTKSPRRISRKKIMWTSLGVGGIAALVTFAARMAQAHSKK